MCDMNKKYIARLLSNSYSFNLPICVPYYLILFVCVCSSNCKGDCLNLVVWIKFFFFNADFLRLLSMPCAIYVMARYDMKSKWEDKMSPEIYWLSPAPYKKSFYLKTKVKSDASFLRALHSSPFVHFFAGRKRKIFFVFQRKRKGRRGKITPQLCFGE